MGALEDRRPYPQDVGQRSLSMEHTRAQRPASESHDIPREIIQAVEAWLVDPRTKAVGTRAPSSGAVMLDSELTSFLHTNGLT
jgi:hypothetical protein